jgi:hypothetical protein
MKKLTTINPVIFVIIFLTLFYCGVTPAQNDKTCPGGGHHNNENIVAGRVMYSTSTGSSDSVPATHGTVKLLRVNPPSLEVIAIDSAQINAFGYYSISGFPSGDYYIVAYPDDKVEDYVISFYPSGQMWNTAAKITMVGSGQARTCNIRSVKMHTTSGGVPVQGETADSGNHNHKLRNAIIIAKSGNEYRGFAITNNQGKYIINSIAPGNYFITATRFGYKNFMQFTSITSAPVTINFYMSQDPSYTISVNGNETIIKDFRLHQNFPNPFNPNTEIVFNLDKGMNVKLTVYSIEGKIVKELLNDYRNAGEYKVSFKGENLSSGIYNYVLETGTGQRESKLMVFTK